MNLPAARADLGPALLAVRKYGSGARPDLDPLATESSRLQASDCMIKNPS